MRIDNNHFNLRITPLSGSETTKIDFVSRRIYGQKHPLSHWCKKNVLVAGAFGFVLAALLSTTFLKDYSHYFSTSLVGVQEIEFTGTVFPVKKVPDWVNMTEAERKMTYQELPTSKLIDIPEYNIADMRAGMKYEGSTPHQRNTYVTYPVPFLGNYNLDATEYSGSHPGYDIKLPIGTPIHAIAAGTISKAQNQPTGYGQHVTIAHLGVPDPDNAGGEVNLFSSYAHLSRISVKVGQVVEKDQIIGYSGDTGLATAPHLHFQIDRDHVPYTPWWPFDWADVQASGFGSFFDAVRGGLHKHEATAASVHPVHYINAHADHGIFTQVTKEDVPEAIVASAEAVIIDDTPKTEPRKTEVVEDTVEEEEVAKILVEEQQETEVEEAEVVEVVKEEPIFTDIHSEHPQKEAIKVLKEEKIFKGYADGTFQPNKAMNRAEALKTILLANKIAAGLGHDVSFVDVSDADWYGPYVAQAVVDGLVRGYDDNTFRPGNMMTRAEFLKVAILATGMTPDTPTADVYMDVPVGEWFAPYFQVVKDYELLVLPAAHALPHAPITRGEAAEILYNLIQKEKNVV